ncbi:MAG: serine/threonine protein kinase, partial [Nitrospirota bacterium]|nr:serine/threonine protein kinase [Nitrospirota bacterium]
MKTQLLAGKIEIQGEIAKGQTGTIYYGYDLELRQEMAIKVYHTHINGRLIRGKAFIEKAKPLLRLEHPNLIKIFKVDEQDGTPVVCMEFFDAPSLQHVIHNEGPLSVEKMLLLAREIAEVLVHIHFQGIIHGTLHPGHVLVGPQGQIKVMDIGLSWILMDILTNCDAELLRPLPYLLPEIAKGELLTLSSDLYCLGFMMFDMLTKRVPYSGLPKTSIMGKLAFDQADPVFDFPDHVPEAICELIRQMTRNDSSHR